MAKYCGKCGAEMPEEAKVCGKCGTSLLNGGYHNQNIKLENPKKKEKTKKKVKYAGILALIIIIIAITGKFVLNSTGYKGIVKKVMKACQSYDIDTLVDMSSDVYYYGDMSMVEEYYQNKIGTVLDEFENTIGHEYKFSYSIEDTYNLSNRKMDEFLNKIASFNSEVDVEAIDKVKIVSVKVTASKGDRAQTMNLDIALNKENGEWKLLLIQ